MISYKSVSLQPLTGGMLCGAWQSIGLPECIVSFPGFDAINERVILDYVAKKGAKVPYYTFSKNALDYGGVSDGAEEYVVNSVTTSPYDASKVKSHFEDVDVAYAVPFCSGLSGAAGIKKGRESEFRAGSDAKQNYNQLHLVDYALKTVKPRVYFYENAPGLCTRLGDGIRETIASRARDNGYSVTFVKTNTLLHGIPQNRPRTFVVFWKWPDGKQCPPPKMSWWNEPKPSVSEWLAGISPSAAQNDPKKDSVPLVFDVQSLGEDPLYRYLKYKFGDEWRNELGRMSTSIYVVMKDFDGFANWAKTNAVPEKYWKIVNSWHDKYVQKGSWWDNGFVTWGDECVPVLFFRSVCRLVHPIEDRTFTIREVMRLMGLPDDLDWPDSLKQNFASLVGQNVPVTTARAMFDDVKRVLDDWDVLRKDYDGTENVVFHDNVKHAKDNLKGTFKWK
jgi:site-specific DNA-cytosine methylase